MSGQLIVNPAPPGSEIMSAATATGATSPAAFPRPSFGSPLTEADLAGLQRRWITPELAMQAGLRRVDSVVGAEVIGRRESDGKYSGILIPYTWPGITGIREYRLRRDHPEFEIRDSKRKEVGKYMGPPGRPSLVYLPPGATPDLLVSADAPIVVLEGEFKTLASWRLAMHETNKPRFLPIGLAGVWNWRGVIGKTTGPNGDRRDVKGPIPDLGRIAWDNKRVLIAFDNDIKDKPDVRTARYQLAKELRIRGAVVGFLEWTNEAKGIDDLLAAIGPAPVLDLIERADYRTPAERYMWNDAGNGDRLADACGADLIYCRERGTFMVWTGRNWAVDELAVERMAEKVLLEAFSETTQITDPQRRVHFPKFLNKSLQRKGIADMVHSAKRKVAQASINDFDFNPELLNFPNVTVDLRTAEARDHRREDRITKVIPYDYNPKANCPLFIGVLNRAMGSHPDAPEAGLELAGRRVKHLQSAFGCAATGKPEKRLFVVNGTGNNSKTTTFECIRAALGPYAGTIQVETLLAHAKDVVGSNAVNADIADLKGLRFVTASEPPQGARLNLARVNYLTGCGELSGRYLRENFFRFQPSHKLFLDCNFKPKITSTTDAIWIAKAKRSPTFSTNKPCDEFVTGFLARGTDAQRSRQPSLTRLQAIQNARAV
jgi:phage/plasmid-associated DNA primase